MANCRASAHGADPTTLGRRRRRHGQSVHRPLGNDLMSERPVILSMTSILRPDPQVVSQKVGKESVLLHLRTEAYFALDAVGSVIWDGIVGERKLGQIRDAIMQTFEVDQHRCEHDLKALADELIRNELATLAEPE